MYSLRVAPETVVVRICSMLTVGVPERIVASAREQFESFSNATESNPEFEAFLLEYFEFGWSEEIPPYWELDTAELEHDGN